jgi:16S rRNA A1518/A1519 N6-dimethyltransferase RsmA/KsgA/DIM1 with predicted DNA glycosylase/AP lyase activity
METSVLNARIQFYQRFSTNECSLHRWIFDQFHLSPESQILELGCGTGQLWPENRDRIPTFTQFIEREIALHGAIRITKRVGLLEASHPRKQ